MVINRIDEPGDEDQEWISQCCEAPPLYELHIDEDIQPAGLCMKCRDNTCFYIMGGLYDDEE